MARRHAGAPQFFHYWCEASDTSAFVPQRNFARTGGAATDPDRALAKALGEAVERYCAAIYDVEELPVCSADEAAFECADPNTFALNSPGQYAERGFAFVPFDATTSVRWVAARDALTTAEIFVPAAMVFVPYYYVPGSGDSPISQPISTGLACHESFEQAATVALCEVIERDAFMIAWQAGLTPPRLELDSLPPPSRDLISRFTEAGFGISLLDITLDCPIPTILAVARHRSPEVPALVVAAAAALDPANAIRSALEELAHTTSYCQEITRNQPRLAFDPDHLNVVDQASHLNYWCEQEHAPGADFLFHSPVARQFGDIRNRATGTARGDLEVVAAAVASTGHRPLLRDLTTDDVRDVGLAVVRAVVPGFHPLVSGHRYRALGGRRLYEVPARMGVGLVAAEPGRNPLPHPYP